MFWLFIIFERISLLLSHVSTSNSFPQPLSPEDEKKYVTAWTQNGDLSAKEKLIEHNLRLVAHIVKKYTGTADSDDLISIGSIGLIKAISTYKPEKCTHLATYASRCIENEVLMHIRATKKQRFEVSLNEPVGVDREGNEISLIDIIGSDGDSVLEDVDLRIKATKLYCNMKQHLSERERVVLELRYGLCGNTACTQREIAKLLDISRSYVSRIEKKAVEKLEKAMKKISQPSPS